MPGGGPISFSQLRTELGGDGPCSISSGRGLAEVPEGPLSMSNFFGKSTYTPPVESVEWRYESTFEAVTNAVEVFVKDNGDGSANALLSWDGVFLNDGISVVFFGDPSGQQWQHPDGRLFRVGSYQQQFPLWVGGPPFTNSYEIGLVTYS